MIATGAWGFTVGSAIFEGAFAHRLLPDQVDRIFRIEGVTA